MWRRALHLPRRALPATVIAFHSRIIPVPHRLAISPMLAGLLILALTGCASFAAHRMAGSLSQAVMNQNDPETVRAGAPAYLLLIDGLILDHPRDDDLLVDGARLYSTYAAVFVDDQTRARRLTEKGRDYGRRALCEKVAAFCDANISHDDFIAALKQIDSSKLPALYTYATASAAWIRARNNDPMALAELPKVTAMLQRVVKLDDAYEHGEAQLYLGILFSQLPPALGGRPEEGKAHFEKAIAYSEGRNLLAKVEYARNYARLVFDRELHDRLLHEVLEADPVAPGYTLGNTLAQQQARQLLDESPAYFEE